MKKKQTEKTSFPFRMIESSTASEHNLSLESGVIIIHAMIFFFSLLG